MAGSSKRLAVCGALSLFMHGCVTSETISFQPKAQQEAIVRDGQPGLVSKRANSVAIVAPAKRNPSAGARPTFTVGVYNAGKTPVTVFVSNISAEQMKDGQPVAPLKVYTYEELVNEERARQVVSAILVGTAAGLNSAAASNAGYYSQTSQVYTPYGSGTVVTSGYSPTAAAIAQSNASAQNAAMIDNAAATGQARMTQLERVVFKDNTVLPGEWYGGTVTFDPPQVDNAASSKVYRITILVGADKHEVDIVQAAKG
ncbi:hypothetical protein [Aquabacter cavernae]|uniref:hypothetical protein n=1 Tax=Aquabacter cavernae TaxID=2496029 RepID=UPI000F8E1108|nr:hypothetical protein [Aquabacter cavernae]